MSVQTIEGGYRSQHDAAGKWVLLLIRQQVAIRSPASRNVPKKVGISVQADDVTGFILVRFVNAATQGSQRLEMKLLSKQRLRQAPTKVTALITTWTRGMESGERLRWRTNRHENAPTASG